MVIYDWMFLRSFTNNDLYVNGFKRSNHLVNSIHRRSFARKTSRKYHQFRSVPLSSVTNRRGKVNFVLIRWEPREGGVIMSKQSVTSFGVNDLKERKQECVSNFSGAMKLNGLLAVS
jgi:hypothetical protein